MTSDPHNRIISQLQPWYEKQMNEIIKENTIDYQIALLDDKVRTFLENNLKPNTVKSYTYDWRQWISFCDEFHISQFPATEQSLARWIAYLSGKRNFRSIRRAVTAVGRIHELSGVENPVNTPHIKFLLRGAQMTMPGEKRKMAPITYDILTRMIDACPAHTMLGRRNAAILALGWAGAMRRSEICGLSIGDCSLHDEGLLLRIRNAKTDRFLEGQEIAIPRNPDSRYCPFVLVSDWLARTGHKGGPLFFPLGKLGNSLYGLPKKLRYMNPQLINDIIRETIHAIGLDATTYGAHSLRSGLATEGGRRGVDERLLARHTRHENIQTLRGYIHAGNRWEENALKQIWPSPAVPPLPESGDPSH